MVRGWAQHPGDRHHGAHGDLVSRSLDVRVGELLDFSQNINPLGAPERRSGSRPAGPLRGLLPLPRPGIYRVARGPGRLPRRRCRDGSADQRRRGGAVPRGQGGRNGRKGARARAHLLGVRGGGSGLGHGGRPQGGPAARGGFRVGLHPAQRPRRRLCGVSLQPEQPYGRPARPRRSTRGGGPRGGGRSRSRRR